MTIRTKMVLPVTLALGMLGPMVMAQVADALHPRPLRATPLQIPLVPAFQGCAAPNNNHGAPLAFPSCNPPVETSDSLTVGTPEVNGANDNSEGSVTIDVNPLFPPDVFITASLTDVRCKPSVSPAVCGGRNRFGGNDYTGEVRGEALVRMTDHYNGPAPGSSGTEPATSVDAPLPVTTPCSRTWKVSIGSTCILMTSVNAIVPGAIQSGKRTVWEVTEIRVFDGGSDGLVSSTAGNTLFEVQGVFVP